MTKRRPATLKIVYRPRKNRVVVLFRNRKVFECRDYDGAHAFIEGWRDHENKATA